MADITYIDTLEGWLYLAGVLDLYARPIVGWAMDENLEATLVERLCSWRSVAACLTPVCSIIPTGAASIPAT